MEKEKLPCGKSKMIGSHSPLVSASHYNSTTFMHSRQRRPLLVKAIRRHVEGPRTMHKMEIWRSPPLYGE